MYKPVTVSAQLLIHESMMVLIRAFG